MDIRTGKGYIKEFYTLITNGIYEISFYEGAAKFPEIETLIKKTNGDDIDEIEENIYAVCCDLDLMTYTLISEIKSRGDRPRMYEDLFNQVSKVIDLVAEKIDFAKDYSPTDKEFISIKESIEKKFNLDLDKMEEDRARLIINSVANAVYRGQHPLYYVYQPLLEILDRVEYERDRAFYKDRCVAAFFGEIETASLINKKDTLAKDAQYYPLTSYMSATPSTIRKVITTKRPFGGVKIPWKGKKKGDAQLLCSILGFTVSEVDNCFSFKGGNGFTTSTKTKAENKDLQEILTVIKILMGKNLPKNLL